MKTPESYEKDEIKKYLNKSKPLVWYFSPSMNGFGKSGVPDIVGCIDYGRWSGMMFGIEVKRPGKEPTAIQWKRMAEIEAAGGKAFWGTAEKVIAEFEAWVA